MIKTVLNKFPLRTKELQLHSKTITSTLHQLYRQRSNFLLSSRKKKMVVSLNLESNAEDINSNETARPVL